MNKPFTDKEMKQIMSLTPLEVAAGRYCETARKNNHALLLTLPKQAKKVNKKVNNKEAIK